MSAEPPEWIREVLSAPRFAPYLMAADGDVDVAVRLYWWNVEVSAAFYTPLPCLELGLRNAMHAPLCEYFGSEDWWITAHQSRLKSGRAAGNSIAMDGKPSIATPT